MSLTTYQEMETPTEQDPVELVELKERVQAQPAEVRAALEPLVEDVLEQARFRSRVMFIAREALERFRLELAMLEFDLAATRRERESFRSLLEP